MKNTPSKEAIAREAEYRRALRRAEQSQNIKAEIAEGEKEREDNRRDIADYETERWQRRAAEELQKHRWSEDLHCELCGLHLTEVQSRKFCKPTSPSDGGVDVSDPEDECACHEINARNCPIHGPIFSKPSDGGQEWTRITNEEYAWISEGGRIVGKKITRQCSEIMECFNELCLAHNASLAACRFDLTLAANKLIAAEREALDEFKQFHHNPIVAQLNHDIAAERRKREQAENIQHAEKQTLLDEIAINAQLRGQLADMTHLFQDAQRDSEKLEEQLDLEKRQCKFESEYRAKYRTRCLVAVDALKEIANDRSAGPIRGVARAALAKMEDRKET